MSTLEIIADALKASSGAIGQGASGMKRIVLIRDRYTAMGIGLAFVEFVDADVSASADACLYYSNRLVCRYITWSNNVTRSTPRGL